MAGFLIAFPLQLLLLLVPALLRLLHLPNQCDDATLNIIIVVAITNYDIAIASTVRVTATVAPGKTIPSIII